VPVSRRAAHPSTSLCARLLVPGALRCGPAETGARATAETGARATFLPWARTLPKTLTRAPYTANPKPVSSPTPTRCARALMRSRHRHISRARSTSCQRSHKPETRNSRCVVEGRSLVPLVERDQQRTGWGGAAGGSIRCRVARQPPARARARACRCKPLGKRDDGGRAGVCLPVTDEHPLVYHYHAPLAVLTLVGHRCRSGGLQVGWWQG